MLISKANFKLSSISNTKEFMVFAHFYGICKNAQNKNEKYLSGIRNFDFAELSDPERQLQEQYEKTVKLAINKLFTLDRAYFKNSGEHICCRLENFSDFQEALREIDEIAMTKEKKAI